MVKNNKIIDNDLKFAVVNSTGNEYITTFDKKSSGNRWIKWGEDNLMPNFLFDSFLKNSNLQAVINTISNYTIGEGVENDNYNELIEKVVNDYILFGGFSLECIRNRKGEIATINYVNVMNVRVNEDLTIAYLSNKWGSYSGKDIIELPLFNPQEKQNHFIYFYRGRITRNINPIPIYIGCLKSVEILNSTRNFHLNNVNNSFNVSAIINLNNGNIKKKELEEIKDKLENNFCGANNAGKFILINNPSKEYEATIHRLNADNFGDIYQALDKSSKEDIYTAFRLNPMLIGINQQTGFQRQEFEDAYNLFYVTVIKPLQNDIIKVFKQLEIEITFKPFIINWSE